MDECVAWRLCVGWMCGLEGLNFGWVNLDERFGILEGVKWYKVCVRRFIWLTGSVVDKGTMGREKRRRLIRNFRKA